jgi:hypothetical protein
MTHRNNIEIDYCPTCRGVWLDKGELDKLRLPRPIQLLIPGRVMRKTGITPAINCKSLIKRNLF